MYKDYVPKPGDKPPRPRKREEPKLIVKRPPKKDAGLKQVRKPPKTKSDKCRLGININPPTPNVKDAIVNLAPVSDNDISNMETKLATVSGFENILASPEKNDIIKQMIIVKSLLENAPPELTDEDIQHIAITIFSNINMVDPQVASFAVAYYSGNEQQPETNPFINVDIPTLDLQLNNDSVNTIIETELRELTDENVTRIGGILSTIKIFMPFDECYARLTRNLKK
jgi:hypothetical protein